MEVLLIPSLPMLRKEMSKMTKALTLLRKAMIRNNSLACCGLDPDITKMPREITKRSMSDEAKVQRFLREVINLTGGHICAYKIQKAFFDVFPKGHALLEETIGYAHERFPNVPVFVDAKIGDIDNTMAAYLRNILEKLEADGVVVNPYMGDEVIAPFASLKNKAGIVLVRTSNIGATVVQDLILYDGRPLWRHMLDLVVERWNKAANLIPVLSATADIDMREVRKTIPDSMPVLFAGFGAQGGTLKHFRQLLDSKKRGVFVNSSRGLLYPYQPEDRNWREKIVGATVDLKETLNRERK